MHFLLVSFRLDNTAKRVKGHEIKIKLKTTEKQGQSDKDFFLRTQVVQRKRNRMSCNESIKK